MTATHQPTSTIGSESSNAMAVGYGVKELDADIALSNNGYLFAISGQMLAVARANLDRFTLSGGLIYKKAGPLPAQYAGVAKGVRTLVTEGPDYEALILDGQARDGFYD